MVLAEIGGGLLGLVLVIWLVSTISSAMPDKKGGDSSDSAPAPPALPIIRVIDLVTNKPDTTVSFEKWQIEGYTLTAIMTWKGDERIDALSYEIQDRGVVLHRGNVSVPGGALIKHQPTKVNLVILEEIKPQWEVTIQVVH